ncbi:MAG: hypothetical protein ACKVII_00380 [Planctomycetales bacterium]
MTSRRDTSFSTSTRALVCAGPFFVAAAMLVFAAGCTEEPEITRRLVAKPSTPASDAPEVPTASASIPDRPAAPGPSEKVDGRMLAAIVPAGGQGWFFKISGVESAVVGQVEKFESLLKTLKIAAGKPVWKTPEGWTEQRGSGMRAATFVIGDPAEKLECSVIALPNDDPASDEYILPNVNRWRGQLSLAKQTLEEMKASDDFKQFDLEDGTTITWVNLSGKVPAPSSGGASTASRPSSAIGSSAAGPSLPPGHPPTGGGNSKPSAAGKGSPTSIPEMSFDVPDGWVSGSLKPFRKISWNIDLDGKTAEFYVSSLAAAGSDVALNVNRWRGQAGLKSLSKEELSNEVEDISVGGESGSLIVISGEKQSIIGAIVVQGDTGWFFKLVGDPDVVSQEKDNVRAFLKSVKFR